MFMRFNFYPAGVKQIIDQLSNQKSGFQWTFTRPDGTKQNFSEGQVTAMVLDEFYQKTQVMIGEAVAVSELKDMIKEHASELPAAMPTPANKPKAPQPPK